MYKKYCVVFPVVRTRWWWVRHAPLVRGVGSAACIYGSTDLACDCSDAAAFTAVASRLPIPAVMIHTPLRRTYLTFKALIAADCLLAEVPSLIESAFIEQCFGAWEGKTWDGLQVAKDPYYSFFWISPFTIRPPAGESFLDVIARVRVAVSRLSEEYIGQDIVAIAHAGSIRAAIAFTLNMTPHQVHNMLIGPLSVTCLDHDSCNGTWRVHMDINNR